MRRAVKSAPPPIIPACGPQPLLPVPSGCDHGLEQVEQQLRTETSPDPTVVMQMVDIVYARLKQHIHTELAAITGGPAPEQTRFVWTRV